MTHTGTGKKHPAKTQNTPRALTADHLQALQELLPHPLFLLDSQGLVLDFTGYFPQVQIGVNIKDVVLPSTVEQIFAAMQQARKKGIVQTIQFSFSIRGSSQLIETRIVAVEDNKYLCMPRAITDRTQMEEALHINAEQMRMILMSAPLVLFAADMNGITTFAQGRGLQAIGRSPEQMLGHTAEELFPDMPEIHDAIHRALAGETLTLTMAMWDTVSEVRYAPLRDVTGKIVGMIGISTDITERVRAEEALRYQSLHDALTSLPNRNFLLSRMAEAIAQANYSNAEMALLLLDIDRFQEINDTFGHQYGDQLLQYVSARLLEIVDASATVARLGGDEFALFLPAADRTYACTAAQTIASILETPIQIGDYPVQVEASTGIALYPTHATDPMALLRHADIAMYHAKRYHDGYIVFDASQDHYQPEHLALLGDLRKAIAENELRLYYQPKASLRTGRVVSVEALLRWQHTARGFIPPDQFIPLAEQTGLIVPLTQWVLKTAIEQCRYWLDHEINLDVAANLSMWNLHETNLTENIAKMLKQQHLPPHHICLEVTESAMMVDPIYTVEALRHLSALGVHIAIDDYGTGYASLSYLKRLSANELKIDRAFVQHVATDRADQAIVQSTITLAHQLGMKVVAEGVEDQAGWNRLAKYGCDIAQGYYLSRPIPAQELELWLQKRAEAPAA